MTTHTNNPEKNELGENELNNVAGGTNLGEFNEEGEKDFDGTDKPDPFAAPDAPATTIPVKNIDTTSGSSTRR